MPCFLLQTNVAFELTYNAPDGSVGTWQKEGFEYQQLEDDGGGGIAGGGGVVVDDHECLIRVEGDNESMGSSPSRSYKGSRLSISSHGVVQQALKSPTKTT